MLNIKQIQMNLKYLNYYSGKIDGISGTQTRNAIKYFQRDNSLVEDGIYGAKTEGCLVPMIKQIQIKIGATADGVAGNNTIEKTKEYQRNNGLVSDGIAGVKTRAKLFQSDSISWKDIKYFQEKEFTCKCGCGMNNIDLRLVKVLDNIREHFGKPVIVTSGCRCVTHNKAVGGVQGSRHVLGKASDIYVVGVSTKDLLAYTQSLVKKRNIKIHIYK